MIKRHITATAQIIYHIVCVVTLVLLVTLSTAASAQGESLELPHVDGLLWQFSSDRHVTVLTADDADRRHLADVFEIIATAREDLHRWQLELPPSHLIIHPNLASYQQATSQPWYVAAVANRTESRMDMQRIRVLVERGSLEFTLRHELFHLAQPEGLPRYIAEGLAMHFAGERPQASAWVGPLPQLERVLAAPRDPQELARAMARSYAEVATALQRAPVTCLLFADGQVANEQCPGE